MPIGVNKKVIGLMKDELGGGIMTELVALRSKMYAYNVLGDVERVSKCKGISKCVVKNLRVKKYKKRLFSGVSTRINQVSIQSREHVVYTESVNKTALSNNDNKRIACKDVVSTLAIW